MTDLRTAALRVLEAWQDQKGMKLLCEAMDDLGAALSQSEDKSQAAFEHWVETVEATQGCAISRNAVADAASIIKPEIKDDKEPFGYFRAEPFGWTDCAPTDEGAIPLYDKPQEKLLPWKGLTEEEHTYYKACGFVGVKAVEEKLRARNSTLVSE